MPDLNHSIPCKFLKAYWFILVCHYYVANSNKLFVLMEMRFPLWKCLQSLSLIWRNNNVCSDKVSRPIFFIKIPFADDSAIGCETFCITKAQSMPLSNLEYYFIKGSFVGKKFFSLYGISNFSRNCGSKFCYKFYLL